jgi:hypothetical protein
MKNVAVILFLFVLSGCSNPCLNTIKSEIKSPDGKYIATAFIRDCGATTSFSPQVHLRPTGKRDALIGNVFVGNRSDSIRIEWLSSTNLVIFSNCEVILLDTNYHGIFIETRFL